MNPVKCVKCGNTPEQFEIRGSLKFRETYGHLHNVNTPIFPIFIMGVDDTKLNEELNGTIESYCADCNEKSFYEIKQSVGKDWIDASDARYSLRSLRFGRL